MRLIDADALEIRLLCTSDSGWEVWGVDEEDIKNAPTIAPPPNDPLTLEELRKMDGEPVWCVSNAQGVARINCWAIVSDDLERCAGNTVWLNFEDYGTWIAYRHNPKEGTI